MNWRQRGSLWCLKPADPLGCVAFIGGSYLAATPQLSYRRLLEALARRGLEIHAWSYVPGFDHQAQANEAWRLFRAAPAGARQWPWLQRPGGAELQQLLS
jgi:hypothetical protein